jgi:hypothetical protein
MPRTFLSAYCCKQFTFERVVRKMLGRIRIQSSNKDLDSQTKLNPDPARVRSETLVEIP